MKHTVTVGELRCMRERIAMMQPSPFLYCSKCGGTFSATPGDYFAASADTVLKCCGSPMRLMRKETRLVEVTK